MDNLGLIIRIARENAGLTRKQLAERTGLAVVTIGQYERGGRHPRAYHLQLLADALGISMQTFSPEFLEQPYIPSEGNYGSLSGRYIPDPSEQRIPGVDDDEPPSGWDILDPSEQHSPGVDDDEPIIKFGSDLGENIRIARQAAGMTQAQLAEQAGVAMGTIQLYESGRRRRPLVRHLQRIAEIFGVSLYELAPSNDLQGGGKTIRVHDKAELSEKIRQTVEVAYLERHHRNQWLRFITRDGKETLYFHGKLNEILYDLTPESIELVSDFAELIRQREAEYFRRSDPPDETK